jgi:hypothetical protein
LKHFKFFLLASMLYGCAGNHPESTIPSDTPSQTNKATLAPAAPVKKTVEINNAEPFFKGLDALQAKVKTFDPSMGELDIMPSDSMFYEGKDTHHNRLQVSGANNGISELSWIWNHDGFQKSPASAIKNFTAIAKIMCGPKGQQWVLSELKKPVSVDKPILDTIHINHNEVIFFNDCLTTINFKVKIL